MFLSSSSSSNVSQEEKSQLLISFVNAKVNYSKIQTIDFKPYMLDIPFSNSSSSSNLRLAIYLPEKHNVEYVFGRYIKIYKNAVGTPATVFIDKRTYMEYTQFANELIKNERALPTPPPPGGPHDLIDDDKVRMINNNISFVINILFQKNRIITTGAKKDRVQTIIAEKPVQVNQSFYLESYNVHAISYTPSGGVKKYESGDVSILEKEGIASDLKAEIDRLATLRQTREKVWTASKQLYVVALRAFKAAAVAAAATVPPTPIPAPVIAAKDNAQETMNTRRDEYIEAKTNEKEKIEERYKLVSEINQLRYGVYPEAIAILKKIQELREGGGGRDREYYYSSYSSSSSSLKTINMDINTVTNNIDLKRAEKTKHETAYAVTEQEIRDEKERILRDIIGTTVPILDVSREYSEAMLDLIPANRDRFNKANELVEILRRKRESERRDILHAEDDIKKKERDLKDLNTRKSQIERDIKKQELALEDYTLRTYLYKITGASLITKYTSTGKKNQQFALLERKGYNESVKGSSEYRKNADQMIKDAPMFSQASCLQKKTEIQTMFDSMLSRAKETVVNAIDNQIGGALDDPVPEPVLFPELRKKYAELKATYYATKEKYEKFNVLKDFVFHEDEPPNAKYFTYTDKCDGDIDCTATIKANESLDAKKKKDEELKQKFERMTKISLGTYPPLLMPRGYYKMHQMVYYESSTLVDLDCEKPPFKKELMIANLDIVLNPSKIPMSFPALMTDIDNVKYNKSIKEKYLFSPIEIEFL